MAKATTDTTTQGANGWTDEERAAMKEHAAELRRAGGKGADKTAEEAQACLDKIAEMPDRDRGLAERIHAIVTATAPDLARAHLLRHAGLRPGRQGACAGSRRPRSSRAGTRRWASATSPHSTTATCGRPSTRSPSSPRPTRSGSPTSCGGRPARQRRHRRVPRRGPTTAIRMSGDPLLVAGAVGALDLDQPTALVETTGTDVALEDPQLVAVGVGGLDHVEEQRADAVSLELGPDVETVEERGRAEGEARAARRRPRPPRRSPRRRRGGRCSRRRPPRSVWRAGGIWGTACCRAAV